MSRAWFALAIAAVLGLFYVGAGRGDSAFAQQEVAENVSTYSVTSAGSTSVLVNSRTGRTWLLHPPASRTAEAAWLPIQRIDTAEEAAKWKAAETERRNRGGGGELRPMPPAR